MNLTVDKSCTGTIVKLSSRWNVFHKSFSLDFIKLLDAIYNTRLDFSLPWRYQLILSAFVIITLFPSALWAGALTPIVASKSSLLHMDLPNWSNTTILAANYHSEFRNLYELNTAQGLFTYRPDFDLQGPMLGTAASASNRTGGISFHPKLDKTGYTYTSRSFGVGASVGLTDDVVPNSTLSYVYNEIGFLSNTSCVYNSTANIQLGDNRLPEDDGWLYSIFEVSGTLPVGGLNVVVGSTAFAFNAGAVVSLYTATSGSSHVLGIVTGADNGSYYSPLNNVQCAITFIPTNFSISAHTINRTISVSPLNEVKWPSYGNLVTNRTVDAMATLSSALTTVYVSILGQTLIYNIANIEARQGPSPSSNLLGISDSINSLIDNILVSYSSAQLIITKDRTHSPVTVEQRSAVIGTPVYIVPIFVVNLAICFIYMLEVIRTKAWYRLPRFNFLDIKTVIVGSSIGGFAVGERVGSLHKAQGTSWCAEEDDRLAGGVRVRLERRGKGRGSGGLDMLGMVLATQDKEYDESWQAGGGRQKTPPPLPRDTNNKVSNPDPDRVVLLKNISIGDGEYGNSGDDEEER